MKTRNLILSVVIVLACSACSSPQRDEIKDEVARAKETIDPQVSPTTRIDDISLDGDNIVCHLTVDDTTAIKKLSENPDRINKIVFEKLSADTSEATAKTLQLMKEADIKIKMVVEDSKGNQFNYIYSPTE